MSPIDAAELSAYLDGELDPARAREVEAALASSPALQADFDALVNADQSWRRAAQTAPFKPRIRLQFDTTPARSALRAASVIVLLLAIRFVPKLAATLELELLLNGIALFVALIWVVRITGADTRARQV